MAANMRFTRPDDATAPGFLVEANSTDNCAVVVIQEWWGINQQMENVAQRLADAGHSALVPDLYRGRLASDADEAKHFMGDLDWPDATHQDLAGAVNYLARTHDRVAVLGFCMGGALTIAGAVHIDGLAGAVCFYGIPPAELADPAKIRCPILAHFATQDDWCTPDAVAALEAAWVSAGVNYELHRYEAQHAFFNEARPEVFDANASELAWGRSREFLSRL